MSNVPLVDLKLQHEQIADEVDKGFSEVLAVGDFIGGRAVSAFEAAYASFVGVPHCVGVGNGTDAIEMALRAVGVGSGDEVILPANTFIATAEAVLRAGAIPVLVDVDDQTLLIDPTCVKQALTERTRAVIGVDLYGQVPQYEALVDVLERRSIVIVEDGAQSQGATRGGRTAGSFGVIAATSFYPGKNLGAYGDAGAVTTQDPGLARRVRLMGAHGSGKKYVHEEFGFNSRLDTLQAVVLKAKLGRLSEWNAQREAAARRYIDLLSGEVAVRLPSVLPGNAHVWHLFVVRVPNRDDLLRELREAGIGAGIHYPVPIHLQPGMAMLGYPPGAFPITERAAASVVSLPIFPGISNSQLERVAEVLLAWVSAR